MKCIRNSVMELSEYFVLQNESIAKLNQNESPYDLPPALKKKILQKMHKSSWNRYPSLQTSHLAEAITAYTDYPSSGILVGNGSNEMIQAIFTSVCELTDKVLFISPGFSIYPRVAKLMGLEIVEVPLLDDFSFDVSAIIEKSKGVRMIIFASPNNPTGTALGIEEIKEIAQKTKCLLVVDEAYFEFHRKTVQHLLNTLDNLVILRTCSKAFGLAGIRLGYLLARPEVVKQVRKAKLPFSVGIFQQIAGEVVMQNKEYVRDHVDNIIRERERIFLRLKEMQPIKPIPSFTNFILFEIQDISAKDVYESLYERGVLVRYFNTSRLKNMLRVTMGTPAENNIFIRSLKKILNEASGDYKNEKC